MEHTFQPLRDMVMLLKTHGISMDLGMVGGVPALDFLEAAPLEWDNTVNKTFRVKEEIQPLQNAMVETIKKDITGFSNRMEGERGGLGHACGHTPSRVSFGARSLASIPRLLRRSLARAHTPSRRLLPRSLARSLARAHTPSRRLLQRSFARLHPLHHLSLTSTFIFPSSTAFVKEFRTNGPFKWSPDDGDSVHSVYAKIDESQKKLVKMEEEAQAFTELEELFELTMSRHTKLKG